MTGLLNRNIKSSLRRNSKKIRLQKPNVPFLQTQLAMLNPKHSHKRPFQFSTSCRFGLPARAKSSKRYTQVTLPYKVLC